jgi:hypothetical protein
MTIKLEVDTKRVVKELDNLLSSVKEISKPKSLDNISRAIFSVTGKRFMIDIDSYSRRNPKKMHHLYEWGKIGNSNARLFVLERSSMINGGLEISTNFLKSKMPVPVNPQLLKPGKTGKSISSRSVFRDKAQVMESGSKVSFTAQKILAFMGSDGVVFVSPGTQINILNPGGIQTKNALATYMLEWYTTKAYQTIDSSGFFDNMTNDVAKILSSKNPTPDKIRLAIFEIVNSIDTGSVIK